MSFEIGDYNQLVVPVMIYTNAYIQKRQILTENKGKPVSTVELIKKPLNLTLEVPLIYLKD